LPFCAKSFFKVNFDFELGDLKGLGPLTLGEGALKQALESLKTIFSKFGGEF
jgi:hypothetical protein